MQSKFHGTTVRHQEQLGANTVMCPPCRQIVSRTFFSLLTIYLICWAVLDSDSRLHSVLANGGPSALASAFILLAAGLAAFLDAILNDALPSRYSFWLKRKHRHYVWGIISVTYMGYAQVFSKSILGLYGAGFYALLGLWAAVIAAMDVWYEYIERSKRNAAE